MERFHGFIPQKLYIREYRQESCAKIGVRVTVYTQLSIPVLFFPCSWQFGVNFAFVMTPRSEDKPDVYSLLLKILCFRLMMIII